MVQQRKTNADPFDKLQQQVDAKAKEIGVEVELEVYSKEWYADGWPARKEIFLEREIKVRDAFHRNVLTTFIPNDAQKELLSASNEAYEDPSLEDFTLKCRRLGISTYYCADYLSDAVIEDGHHVRIVAQDPKTVGALMKVVKTMYDNLRPEIKPVSKYNSKYELEFDNGSKVSISTVVPGHEEQGRGDTFTRLHLTEIPFWKGDAETAATALCDAAKGGKITGESTAKGVGDWFHQKFIQGKRKEGGIRSHFFEWWWNTNYQISGAQFAMTADGIYLLLAGQVLEDLSDGEKQSARITQYSEEEQREKDLPMQSEFLCAQKIALHLVKIGELESPDMFDDAVARRLAWRRQEIAKKKEKKFRVEYPENDVDPFAQTGGSVFDQNYAKVGCEPRDPEAGHTYIVGCDPSIGIENSGDPAVITVIDRFTGEQVYSWRGFERQDSQGERCCILSDKYLGADIVVESNMGEAAIIEIENRGYGHRLYRHIDVQTQRDVEEGKVHISDALSRARPGLPMTERIKRTALGLFEKAWRQGDFTASSQNLCDEAVVFVQNGNKMEAKSGYHDDEIMANVCAWFVIEMDYVAKASFKSSGIKTGSAQMKGF